MPLISVVVNKQETKPNDLADFGLLVQQSILMLEDKAKKKKMEAFILSRSRFKISI